ncbi:hypothetical protein RN001_004521 [Aquatica leii]|uniref:TIL domain-containing protein n=1 Tax=Aquatica leii TaxID=1421715 RepID=A0AAN7PAT7_9COLE|nr:hypothetical protein RN001_004521 [Aquatica leii]
MFVAVMYLQLSLLVVISVNYSTAEVCGKNEVFSICSSHCPATCKNPIPGPCILSCRVGCMCKQGYLKNSQEECVSNNEC